MEPEPQPEVEGVAPKEAAESVTAAVNSLDRREMEISPDAAAFLGFIDACSQGAEAVKARFTETMIAHLASTGQEGVYSQVASQGSAFAGDQPQSDDVKVRDHLWSNHGEHP